MPPRVTIAGETLSAGTLPGLLSNFAAQIFPDCSLVMLSPFYSKGYSGAQLVRVTAQKHSAIQTFPYVLKLGKTDKIKKELSNFREFVHGSVENAPTLHKDQPAVSGEWAAIAYRILDGHRKFEEFYESSSEQEIRRVIEKLFNNVFRNWIESRRVVPRTDLIGPLTLRESAYTALDSLESRHQERWPVQVGSVWKERFETWLGSGEPGISAISHGDMNGGNILVDQEGHICVIDFALTGRAHFLADFARLECEVRYKLGKQFSDERNLNFLLEVDRSLSLDPFAAWIPGGAGNRDPESSKFFNTISFIRSLAFDRMIGDKEKHIRDYYLLLAHYAIRHLSYPDVLDVRKMFAFGSAAIALQRSGPIEVQKQSPSPKQAMYRRSRSNWLYITRLPTAGQTAGVVGLLISPLVLAALHNRGIMLSDSDLLEQVESRLILSSTTERVSPRTDYLGVMGVLNSYAEFMHLEHHSGRIFVHDISREWRTHVGNAFSEVITRGSSKWAANYFKMVFASSKPTYINPEVSSRDGLGIRLAALVGKQLSGGGASGGTRQPTKTFLRNPFTNHEFGIGRLLADEEKSHTAFSPVWLLTLPPLIQLD